MPLLLIEAEQRKRRFPCAEVNFSSTHSVFTIFCCYRLAITEPHTESDITYHDLDIGSTNVLHWLLVLE